MHLTLTNEQENIINDNGNVIVNANAGTGKTATMIMKIEKDNSKTNDLRSIAAITFTIKAAKEIKDRLNIDSYQHFFGTNNSFVVEEVIKPFAKNVYDELFVINSSYTTDYNIRFDTFEEAITKLTQSGIICSYKDPEKNFIYELGLKILKESKTARMYIISKYKRIYVDEYQDSDTYMNDFFLYLYDKLGIKLFLIGDEKQSIYAWRGAHPENFIKLFGDNRFNPHVLTKNFRSHISIQNFSNILFDRTVHLFDDNEIEEDDLRVNFLPVQNIYDIKTTCDKINLFLDYKKCALIRFTNNNVRNYSEMLDNSGNKFKVIERPMIADISNISSYIYLGIAKFCIIEKYSEFDFLYEIPNLSDDYQRNLNTIGNYLMNIKNKSNVKNNILNLFKILNYNVNSNDIVHMLELLNNLEKYRPYFETHKFDNVAMTVHSSKGLEFELTVVFAVDFINRDQIRYFENYVALTRSKEKIIVVYDYKNDKKYIDYIKGIICRNGFNVDKILKILD